MEYSQNSDICRKVEAFAARLGLAVGNPVCGAAADAADAAQGTPVTEVVHTWNACLRETHYAKTPRAMNAVLLKIQQYVVGDLVTYFTHALPRCFDGAWRNDDGTLALGNLREKCDIEPYALKKLPGTDAKALSFSELIFVNVYLMIKSFKVDVSAGDVPNDCIIFGLLCAIFNATEVRIEISETTLHDPTALMVLLFAQAVRKFRPTFEMNVCFTSNINKKMRDAITMILAPVALHFACMSQ